MNKEIENLIQKKTLRDVEIKLKEAQIEGFIIPDLVFEIISQVEDSYGKVEDTFTSEKDEETNESKYNG